MSDIIVCRDCAQLTGGHCWRHATTMIPLGPVAVHVCPVCYLFWRDGEKHGCTDPNTGERVDGRYGQVDR